MQEQFEEIFERVCTAAKRSGREASAIKIVGVGKKQSTDVLNKYLSWCHEKRIGAFLGENYLQEYLQKESSLAYHCEKHYIGRIQSKKIPSLLKHFDVVQTLSHATHRDSLLQYAKSPVRVYLQVNVSKDSNKEGIFPAEVKSFFDSCMNLPLLKVEGLMTITQAYDNPEHARFDFTQMRKLRDALSPSLELSMGMSNDFECAIEEGATIVRIGSGLFGARDR